jgi:hypothetical protein
MVRAEGKDLVIHYPDSCAVAGTTFTIDGF